MDLHVAQMPSHRLQRHPGGTGDYKWYIFAVSIVVTYLVVFTQPLEEILDWC